MMLVSILAWAVISLSSSFLRSAPDYEAPLDTQLQMGALVETSETNRYWVKVSARDYTGWVTNGGIVPLSDGEKEAYLKAPKWICVVSYACVRESPDERSAQVSDLIMGDLLRQTGVSKRGWLQVLLPTGRKGWVLKHELMDFRTWAESRAGTALSKSEYSAARGYCGREIISLARNFIGTPYMWGGNTVKHFDCSGLVQFCYFMNGILLPRNASQQYRCGTPVTDGTWEPGDLLFFGTRNPLKITHVAMFSWHGAIIHSAQYVREMSLAEYGREVVAVTRILSDVDSGKGAVSVLHSPYYFIQDGGEK